MMAVALPKAGRAGQPQVSHIGQPVRATSLSGDAIAGRDPEFIKLHELGSPLSRAGRAVRLSPATHTDWRGAFSSHPSEGYYAGLVAPHGRGAGGFLFNTALMQSPLCLLAHKRAPFAAPIVRGGSALISLRSKPPSNPAQDCTDRFKGLAPRHGSHDGGVDDQEVGGAFQGVGNAD